MTLCHDINEMPPKMFMMQIMDSLAKAYCFLWERRDDENRIRMSWDEIRDTYHMNNFRTCIRKLCEQGLLTYNETLQGIFIELVGWNEVSED